MIPMLVAKLVGAGIPQRLAKPILAIGAIIAAALLLWIVIAAIVRNHNEQVIERHDAKVNLEAFETKGKLDELTADLRVKDAIRETKQRAELEKVIADETKPIDDRRAALRQCIRLQQRAAKANLPVPDCR